jgi:hypothetical protein
LSSGWLELCEIIVMFCIQYYFWYVLIENLSAFLCCFGLLKVQYHNSKCLCFAFVKKTWVLLMAIIFQKKYNVQSFGSNCLPTSYWSQNGLRVTSVLDVSAFLHIRIFQMLSSHIRFYHCNRWLIRCNLFKAFSEIVAYVQKMMVFW